MINKILTAAAITSTLFITSCDTDLGDLSISRDMEVSQSVVTEQDYDAREPVTLSIKGSLDELRQKVRDYDYDVSQVETLKLEALKVRIDETENEFSVDNVQSLSVTFVVIDAAGEEATVVAELPAEVSEDEEGYVTFDVAADYDVADVLKNDDVDLRVDFEVNTDQNLLEGTRFSYKADLDLAVTLQPKEK